MGDIPTIEAGYKPPRRLAGTQQVLSICDWMSEGWLRDMIFQRKDNGWEAENVTVKISGRRLIDLDNLFSWIERHGA